MSDKKATASGTKTGGFEKEKSGPWEVLLSQNVNHVSCRNVNHVSGRNVIHVFERNVIHVFGTKGEREQRRGGGGEGRKGGYTKGRGCDEGKETHGDAAIVFPPKSSVLARPPKLRRGKNKLIFEKTSKFLNVARRAVFWAVFVEIAWIAGRALVQTPGKSLTFLEPPRRPGAAKCSKPQQGNPTRTKINMLREFDDLVRKCVSFRCRIDCKRNFLSNKFMKKTKSFFFFSFLLQIRNR